MKQIIKKADPEFIVELELLNLIAELITEIIINETTKDNSIMIIKTTLKMEIKGVLIPCCPDHKRDCDNAV